MAITISPVIEHVVQFGFEQAPGTAVFSRIVAWRSLVIKTVRAYIKTAPTTAGSYDMDVKVDGSTILSSKLNLKSGSITNATWTNASISDGGVSAGEDILIIVVSDNGDLSGGEGLVVQIEIQ